MQGGSDRIAQIILTHGNHAELAGAATTTGNHPWFDNERGRICSWRQEPGHRVGRLKVALLDILKAGTGDIQSILVRQGNSTCRELDALTALHTGHIGLGFRFFCTRSHLDVLEGTYWIIGNSDADLALGRRHRWTVFLSTHQGVP